MGHTTTIWEDDSDSSIKGHRIEDNEEYDNGGVCEDSEEEIESEVPHAIEHVVFVGESDNAWMQTASDAVYEEVDKSTQGYKDARSKNSKFRSTTGDMRSSTSPMKGEKGNRKARMSEIDFKQAHPKHRAALQSRKQLYSGLDAEHMKRVQELEKLVDVQSHSALESKRANARALINRVMKSPFERNRKIILLKAFFKWHRLFPMHQKADELARQMQDRLVAIASIRDSYLRDIVRVKYHLDKIREYQFPIQNNRFTTGKDTPIDGNNESKEDSKLDLDRAKEEAEHAGKTYTEVSSHDMYDLHTVRVFSTLPAVPPL